MAVSTLPRQTGENCLDACGAEESAVLEVDGDLVAGAEVHGTIKVCLPSDPSHCSLTVLGREEVFWEEEVEHVEKHGREVNRRQTVVERHDTVNYCEDIEIPVFKRGSSTVPFTINLPNEVPASTVCRGDKWGMTFDGMSSYELRFTAVLPSGTLEAHKVVQVVEPPLRCASTGSMRKGRWRRCFTRGSLDMFVSTDQPWYAVGDTIQCTIQIRNRMRGCSAITLKLWRNLNLNACGGYAFSLRDEVATAVHGGISFDQSIGSVSVALIIPSDLVGTQCMGSKVQCSYTISVTVGKLQLDIPVCIRPAQQQTETVVECTISKCDSFSPHRSAGLQQPLSDELRSLTREDFKTVSTLPDDAPTQTMSAILGELRSPVAREFETASTLSPTGAESCFHNGHGFRHANSHSDNSPMLTIC